MKQLLLKYKADGNFSIDKGFVVTARNVLKATHFTNEILFSLPSTLYKTLDFKTISAMVGSIFCDSLANYSGGIVNPIEKGHPDIIPAAGEKAKEAALRNYPEGIEIKCTIGNIETGAKLRAGHRRLEKITGITWQAHHTQVTELMGLVWDFVHPKSEFLFPGITGAFFSDDLNPNDWGKISGITGRNTKVTGMKASGRQKMGAGCIIILDNPAYIKKYSELLGIKMSS